MCCAEFLGMHNLEDSCFLFLQAQMKSEVDNTHTSQSPPSPHPHASENPNVSQDDSKPPLGSRPHPRDLSSSKNTERLQVKLSDPPLTFDPHHYPKYRKYHQAKHNLNTSHSSTSNLLLAETGGPGGPDLSKVKAEPTSGEDLVALDLSEVEQDGREDEMEIEMDFDDRQLSSTPNELPLSKRSPVCLRSFVKKEATSSDPCFAVDLHCAKRTSHAQDGQKYYQAFVGELGVTSSKRCETLTTNMSVKSLFESDRRSVIFSPVAPNHLPAHSYPRESYLCQDAHEDPWAGSSQSFPCSQTLSPTSASQEPPMSYRRRPKSSCPVPIKMCPRSSHAESHIRTSSSCSSYSYAEDGSGGSPSSLPQFELSTSPCSTMERCLALEHRERSTAGPPKIKCEKSYDSNSSDESESFSDGDSESCPSKERRQEVGWSFVILCEDTHAFNLLSLIAAQV